MSETLKSRKAETLKRWAFGVLCAAAVLLTGCSEKVPENASDVRAEVPESVVTSDGVELTMRADAREIDVGQPLRVELTVRADADVDVRLPAIEGELGSFEVRKATRVPAIPVDGKRESKLQLELMTFEEGELEVPAIEVTLARRDESASEVKLESKPLTIIAQSVVGADADPSAFRDIKGAAEMPSEPMWKWWAIGLASAALLVALLAAMIAWWRVKREPVPVKPLLPHEWALRELDALAKDGLIEQRAFEPFYVRLSAVVRGYLERRFGLMAPERTTDEFLREARRSRHLNDAQRELLGNFLRAADMVKFAKFEPMETDCRDALASARSFVEQTIPREQPASGVAA